ncbi:DUF1283 family protein [Xenorhabdus innexi]|uniref:UPF0482 protein Xinn_00116 n=1 Tax=Xenorhabdus innexi TaxID=290109 RepID=A0A1N6MY11_9GAMM|nr:DUF1283 family protein [Xenorhabdus innexi]PHM38830.1 hypothetical protein Xinn_00116 [Xenorhabdus innexi]SIP73726.1 conserved exported hypothetical protein [Xenorhabdus innexi]
MNIHRLLTAITLPAIALLLPLFWQTPAFSTPCTSDNCVIINGGGENSMTRETARQDKEMWNEQRSLREKMTQRREKKFEEHENDVDNKDACLKNSNLNAYWEPSTKRCLDVNTGRPINPE